VRRVEVAARVLLVSLIERHLRAARLEHRGKLVAVGHGMGDDKIDIVEIEGGVEMSIRLRGRRFGVVRYHHDDDGEVGAVEDCGWFDTPGEAAARVAAVLRRGAAR
jgi:hypothetical protein